MTEKGQITVDYLKKYPNTPTQTIAKLLMVDFPELFSNLEAARALVRTYRGEHGRSKFLKINVSMRTKQQKEDARNWAKLPESDYVKVEAFVVPKGNNKGLILNDIHLPYQDNDALETALNYGLKFNPNFVFLNGDTIDMYQASRFIKDKRLRDLAGEIEITREFLKDLQAFFNCPIYFKIGNHEDRWENYLKIAAPELLGIAEFELQNILRFGESGVQLVKSKQIAKIGKLTLAHGHEFGQSVFSPVNAARGLYTRAKIDCAIGHHHVTSEHSEKDMDGNVVTTYSIGALCGLAPDYLPYNKWNHGFATIETDLDGEYEFRNLRISDGKVR
jgi:hypothetical protein